MLTNHLENNETKSSIYKYFKRILELLRTTKLVKLVARLIPLISDFKYSYHESFQHFKFSRYYIINKYI